MAPTLAGGPLLTLIHLTASGIVIQDVLTMSVAAGGRAILSKAQFTHQKNERPSGPGSGASTRFPCAY